MEKPLVSIIVPVYNIEEYLPRCLDSLVNQSMREIEILVVNDGSTDDSQEVIDRYTILYPDRVKGFIKPNGGLSDARNYAVERAKGDYIGFVDGDDTVHRDMYRDLYAVIQRNRCQMVVGQYIHYTQGTLTGKHTLGHVYPHDKNTVLHGRDLLLQAKVGIVCVSLYEKRLIGSHPFPDIWFEDIAWFSIVLSHTERLCVLPKPLYYWMGREGSISKNNRDLRTLEDINAVKYALEHCNPEEKDAVAVFATRRLLFSLRHRPVYADRYAQALIALKDDLLPARYLADEPSLYYRLIDYTRLPATIPKVLYYDAFGLTVLSPEQAARVDGWSERMIYDDGRIVRLDETNCDIRQHPTVSALYDAGQFARVGQYFKLKALMEQGGVAIETTMDARGFLAPYLTPAAAFFGFSNPHHIQTSLYGACAKHPLLQKLSDALLTRDMTAQEVFNKVLLQENGLVYSPELPKKGKGYLTIDSSVRIYHAGLFAYDFANGKAVAADTTLLAPEHPCREENLAFFCALQSIYNEKTERTHTKALNALRLELLETNRVAVSRSESLERKQAALEKKQKTIEKQQNIIEKKQNAIEKEKARVAKAELKIARLREQLDEQKKRIRMLEQPFYKKNAVWRFLSRVKNRRRTPLDPPVSQETISPDIDTRAQNREPPSTPVEAVTAPQPLPAPLPFQKPTAPIPSPSPNGKKRVLLYTGNLKERTAFLSAKWFADRLCPTEQYELTVFTPQPPNLSRDRFRAELMEQGLNLLTVDPDLWNQTRAEIEVYLKDENRPRTPDEQARATAVFAECWHRCLGGTVFDISVCLFSDRVSPFYALFFAMAPFPVNAVCRTYLLAKTAQIGKSGVLSVKFDRDFIGTHSLFQGFEDLYCPPETSPKNPH